MDYKLKLLETYEEAGKVVDFFNSEDSFDDRCFTQGELLQINTLPFISLSDPDFYFWMVENREKEIIAVASLRENEQKSGGFILDYLAVHRGYRKMGIASELVDIVLKHASDKKGRYLIVNTCDTTFYKGVRHILEKRGFERVGHVPDYYFEGEGLIMYYMRRG
jgi:ribosomal protein S18 acetylase RimI-like enzyme